MRQESAERGVCREGANPTLVRGAASPALLMELGYLGRIQT